MSRRGLAWGCGALAAVLVLGTLLLVPGGGADASALAAGPRGWLAARRYLERGGVAVTLADAPLVAAATPGAGTWVLAFPWQGRLGDGELEALAAHLRAGGTVLVACSRALDQPQEQDVLSALGLDARSLRDRPPLVPWRWWTYQRQTWSLEPGDGWEGATAPDITVPARRAVPLAPAGAAVLYRYREADAPLVFSYRLHRGRVVVLPADVLANGYLLAAGHADFLESLRRWLGDAWRFDEYHHGLVDPRLAAARGSTFAWDLFMAHLALFYVLGFLGLARRFGPPWREAAAAMGSTAAYLRQLGALHRELGHHPAAARLLAERSRELDPALPEVPVPETVNDAGLVDFARRLTRRGGST